MKAPNTSIRESIMYMLTRSIGTGAADPPLSDETAFVIQLILDDLWLWFNTIYGEQARRYRPPPDLPAPDGDLPDDPF